MRRRNDPGDDGHRADAAVVRARRGPGRDPRVVPAGRRRAVLAASRSASGSRTRATSSSTTLAFAAAATERVRIVSTVAVLPIHDPVRFAKQMATIDVLSGGRLTVGVGVGGRDSGLRRARRAVRAALRPPRRAGRDDAARCGGASRRRRAPADRARAGAGRRPAAAHRVDGPEVARPQRALGRRVSPASISARIPRGWTRRSGAPRTPGWPPAGRAAVAVDELVVRAGRRRRGAALRATRTTTSRTSVRAAAQAMAGLCRLSDPGAIRETIAALRETGCNEIVLVPTTHGHRRARPAARRGGRAVESRVYGLRMCHRTARDALAAGRDLLSLVVHGPDERRVRLVLDGPGSGSSCCRGRRSPGRSSTPPSAASRASAGSS